MKKHEVEKLVIDNIKNARSVSNLIEIIGLTSGGGNNTRVKEIIKKNELDITHFGGVIIREKKYKDIEKKCVVCNNKFITKLGHKKEQNYCSISCSNKDRIVSDETKEKLRKNILKYDKIYKLVDKYGEGVIGVIQDMRLNGKTYLEIIKATNVSEDDVKIFFNVSNLNFPINCLNSYLLKQEDVIKLYLEVKNLKKVSKLLGVSYKTIRNHITDDLLIKKTINKTNSERVVSWRQRKKQALVEYKGGCCEKCGYSKSVSALQFHHINPNEKDFTIGGSSYSFERLKKEVDKCIMVCSNCHIEIHEELRKLK